MKNIIKDIGTFVYGFIATIFCWSCIIVGGFSVWLAFTLGVQADPFDLLIISVGFAFGIAGIHGFYWFLVEEKLMEDYFGVLPKE
jgi:hypothetical protein